MHVLTWWPSTNNGPATPLVDAAQAQPGVGEVLLSQRSSKNAMMASVERLMLESDDTEQVDTFLANAGRDVLRWTPCGGEGSSQRVLRLDDRYPELSSVFAPEILSGVTCCPSPDGCSQPGIYALPLGLHRINHIFYNAARFEPCSALAVHDGPSFAELLRCLGVDGQRVISAPVRSCEGDCALNEEACWLCRGIAGESLSYLLESLLLLVTDPRQYQSYWRGQSWQGAQPPEESPLRQALALFEGELLPYLNNCPAGSQCLAPANAEAALEEVADGRAAFLVMPDWFTLDVQRRETVKGRPFPGTDDTFLFMTDVFTIPLGTPGTSVEAGLRWLDTLLDVELQQRFARQKHALPARGDHSELQLLPSLEAQLPASVDPARIRTSLNEWLLALRRGAMSAGALEELMDQEFGAALRQGTLRVAPCDSSPCGKP